MKTKKYFLVVVLIILFGICMQGSVLPEKVYEEAQELMISGSYTEAAEKFESIPFYEDSVTIAQYCRSQALAKGGNHKDASLGFESVDFFGDSELQIQYCNAYSLAFESGENSYLIRKGAEKFESILAYRDSAALSEKAVERANSIDYAAADKEYSKGNYYQAYEIYVLLQEYRDSKACAEEALNMHRYTEASALERDKDFYSAYVEFKKLENYKDSRKHAEDCLEKYRAAEYACAEELENNQQFEEAKMIFNSLGNYRDCRERTEECLEKYNAAEYAHAEKLENSLQIEEAKEIFIRLGDYRDSKERAEKVHMAIPYSEALSLENEKQYFDACEIYITIEEYKDSAERAEYCMEQYYSEQYTIASKLEEAGEFYDAYTVFHSIEDYSDSKERAGICLEKYYDELYREAEALEKDGDYVESYFTFLNILEYKDSQTRAEELFERAWYQLGSEALADGQYEDAHNYFNEISTFEDSDTKRYLAGTVYFADEMNQYTEDVAMYSFRDEWGLVNFADNRMSHPAWESYEGYNPSRIVVSDEGKYGLIDNDGNTVFPCEWEDYEAASDTTFLIRKNGLYGMVDLDGNVLIEPTWESYLYMENVIVFKEEINNAVLTGVATRAGTILFDAQWEDIFYLADNTAKTVSENQYGIIDLDGREITDCRWTAVADRIVGGDFILFKEYNSESRYYELMNREGDFVTPYPVKSLGSGSDPMDAKFNDGWMIFETQSGKFGYVNCTGGILPPEYEGVLEFSNERAGVEKDGFWGFIDTEGSLVVENKYCEIESFNDGFAPARMQNGQWFILSKDGRYNYFKDTRYELAKEFEEAGKYSSAIELYDSLNNYDDSLNRILKCREALAEELFAAGDFDGAKEQYLLLGSGYETRVEDCDVQITIRDYQRAVELENAEEYDEALDLFQTVEEYEDAKEHIRKIEAISAYDLFAAGRYEEAKKGFEQLSGYADMILACQREINLAKYNHAVELEEAEQYEEAVILFDEIKGYQDSADHIRKLNAYHAYALMEQGKYEEARAAFFEEGEGYEDELKECGYQIGQKLYNNGEYEAAAQELIPLSGYKDVDDIISHCEEIRNEQLYCEAKELFKKQKYEAAVDNLLLIRGYKDAEKLLMVYSLTYANSLDDIDFCYKAAKYYAIAAETRPLNDIYCRRIYKKGTELYKNAQYRSAAAYFDLIPDYKDSKDQSLKVKYAYVKKNVNTSNAIATTYEYLQDLVTANYYDSQIIYEKYYGWHIEYLRVNNDPYSHEKDLSSGIKNDSTMYFHFRVSGGPPGETLKLRMKIEKSKFSYTLIPFEVKRGAKNVINYEYRLSDADIEDDFHGNLHVSLFDLREMEKANPKAMLTKDIYVTR